VAVDVSHALTGAVNGGDGRFEAQFNAVLVKESIADHRQVFRRLAAEILGQMHAVIGGAQLFAKHDHTVALVQAVID